MNELPARKCLLLAGLVLLATVDHLHSAVDATPSAQMLFDKYSNAMRPPIRYRTVTGASQSDHLQKVLSDGRVATRIDTILPIRMTIITVGDEQFEVFPDDKLIVDTSRLQESIKAQAGFGAVSNSASQDVSSATSRSVIRQGRRCYELEFQVDPLVVASVNHSLPPALIRLVPISHRLVIDGESYELIEACSILADGTTQGVAGVSDISREGLDTFPDEHFLPPNGMKIVKPNSLAEHAGLIAAVNRSNADRLIAAHQRAAQNLIDSYKPAAQLSPMALDRSTGLAIPPTPPGIGEDTFRRNVKDKAVELSTVDREPAPNTRANGTRKMLLFLNLLIVSTVAGCVIYRRMRSTKR